MPDYRAPGMAASRRVYARRAVIFLAAAIVVILAAVVIVDLLPDNETRVTMHTDTLAGGIVEGSAVVLNGAEVGKIVSIKAPRPGTYEIGLTIADKYLTSPQLLTSSTLVTYAPKNLFGIGAVVLNSTPGGHPIGDGGDFFPDQPVDATLTSLLRNLSDLQTEAFGPYMGDILKSANTATDGLLPIMGVLGQLADDISQTQKFPTATTLPQFTKLISGLRGTTDLALPPLMNIMKWQAPQRPGYVEKQYNGLHYVATTTMDDTKKLLSDKVVGILIPQVPVIDQLVRRMIDSFPEARKNGIQIATLIDRIDAALKPGPHGPTMTVDVVLDGIPGIAAALGVRGAR